MDRSFNGGSPSGAGPARPLKPLPKSAAALGAGNRTAGRHRRGRVPASATTYRMPMTPPVCGAGPGRLLELQTSLGLMLAKDILERAARSRDSHMHQHQLSSSLPSKGFLKSGRLQPLGVVDTPPLQADQCLGIILSGEREEGRGRHQGRYRSSTMPGLRASSDGQWEGRRKVLTIRRDLHMAGEKRTRTQRSYSAVACSFDSSEFARSMSPSKPLALVPQRASDESSVVLSEERMRTSQPIHSTRILPPVVSPQQRTHQEGKIWVEVKAFRKTEHNSDSLGGEGITDQNEILSSKLPHIPLNSSAHTTHTSPSELSESRAPDGTTRGDEAEKEKKEDEEERKGKKVNMVVVGTVMEKKGGKGPRRRRHSGNRTGKLSYGWSQPRPLDTLTGHSVVSPNGPKRGGEEGRGGREKGRDELVGGGGKHSTHTTKGTVIIGR